MEWKSRQLGPTNMTSKIKNIVVFLIVILSFMNKGSKANIVKWKVSKKGICLCVCLSWLKSFDGMKGSWWNFQDHSNSVQVILEQGRQISLHQGYGPVPKPACFWKICLLSEFLSYMGVTYLFGNLRTRSPSKFFMQFVIMCCPWAPECAVCEGYAFFNKKCTSAQFVKFFHVAVTLLMHDHLSLPPNRTAKTSRHQISIYFMTVWFDNNTAHFSLVLLSNLSTLTIWIFNECLSSTSG